MARLVAEAARRAERKRDIARDIAAARPGTADRTLAIARDLLRPWQPAHTVGDASVRTHNRVRVDGVSIVHRLTSTRGRLHYTTGCGLRIAKADGVLTAGAVDCAHYGCGVTA